MIDLVLGYAAQEPPPTAYQLWAGDIDPDCEGDGDRDLFDVLALIDCVLGKETCPCPPISSGPTGETVADAGAEPVEEVVAFAPGEESMIDLEAVLIVNRPIKGLLLELDGIPEGLQLQEVVEGDQFDHTLLEFNQDGSRAQILLASLDFEAVDVGRKPVLILRFSTPGKAVGKAAKRVRITQLQLADKQLQPIKGKLRLRPVSARGPRVRP